MHIIQLLEIHKSILYPNAFIFNLSESHAISRGGEGGTIILKKIMRP